MRAAAAEFSAAAFLRLDNIATDFSAWLRYTVFTEVLSVVYLDLVLLLNFSVDFLLLMGTNALSGFRQNYGRITVGAAMGGLYAAVCLLPDFRFLGNLIWRTIALLMMGVIAFGVHGNSLRRIGMFLLLSMALGGAMLGLGNPGPGKLLLAATGLVTLCMLGIWQSFGRRYTTVVLTNGQKQKTLTALYDTGNTLRDPVSGERVLVVGPDIAEELLGLTQQQLCSPLEAIQSQKLPGLRLIPYKAVGQSGGLLLAARMDEVRFDGHLGTNLVAFAPNKLGNRTYQALAGGI